MSAQHIPIGTTVRVDRNGRVLAQSDDDESVEIHIGDTNMYNPGNDPERGVMNYFGIVWGRVHERLSGLDDDQVDDEDPDYWGLYYDIVVLGSNSAWSYDVWDELYENMKENLELENRD